MIVKETRRVIHPERKEDREAAASALGRLSEWMRGRLEMLGGERQGRTGNIAQVNKGESLLR